jgi:hypothetical protein
MEPSANEPAILLQELANPKHKKFKVNLVSAFDLRCPNDDWLQITIICVVHSVVDH